MICINSLTAGYGPNQVAHTDCWGCAPGRAPAWNSSATVCLHSTAVWLYIQWCCRRRSAEQAKAYARGMGEALEATYETTKKMAARAAERAREAGQQAAENSRETAKGAKERAKERAASTASELDSQGRQAVNGGRSKTEDRGDPAAREAAETAGSAIDRAKQAARETFQAAEDRAERGADKAREAKQSSRGGLGLFCLSAEQCRGAQYAEPELAYIQTLLILYVVKRGLPTLHIPLSVDASTGRGTSFACADHLRPVQQTAAA